LLVAGIDLTNATCTDPWSIVRFNQSVQMCTPSMDLGSVTLIRQGLSN